MSSSPVRDPKSDHLLTPANSTLVLIDYQPPQVYATTTIDRTALIANVVALAKAARLFKLPIVLSTVNVIAGVNPNTIPQLRDALPNVKAIDRTSMNSWEDADFVRAVEATGRKKLIMGALWTEICLAFPSLDAIKAGYEVYAVTDVVGGTSAQAHEAGLARVQQAGGTMVSWVSVLCELQRDWNRPTANDLMEIVKENRGTWGWELVLKEEQPKKVA